jgi:hypothetical protein
VKHAQFARERVYFIEAVGLDMIKIGYARDIPERLRKLSPGCPVPMRLLGTVPGGLRTEQQYHERLAGCRDHGEWFRRCPELEGVLAAIDKPAEIEPPAVEPTDDPRDAKRRAFYKKYRNRPFGPSWAKI